VCIRANKKVLPKATCCLWFLHRVAAKLMMPASHTIFDGRKGSSALAGWQGRRKRTEEKIWRKTVDQLQMGEVWLFDRSRLAKATEGWAEALGNGKNMLSASDREAEIEEVICARTDEGWVRKLFITLSFRMNLRVARDETTPRGLSSCNFSLCARGDSAIQFRWMRMLANFSSVSKFHHGTRASINNESRGQICQIFLSTPDNIHDFYYKYSYIYIIIFSIIV